MRASARALLRSTVALVALLAPAAAMFGGCGSAHQPGGGSSASGSTTSTASAASAASASSGVGGNRNTSGSSGNGGSPDGPDTGAPETGTDAQDEGPHPVGDAGTFADGGEFSGDCGVGAVGEPTDLRCTGLYADFTAKTIAANVHAYDPGLHLWSDGADKSRWIYLPPGEQIDTTDMDEWTFPIGTKIFKEFRLDLGDAGSDTRIETRMMWKQADGTWYFTTYRWTADGESDATELTSGEFDVAGTTYEIPTQGECGDCHNGRMDQVMGFEAVSLSTAASSGFNMQALLKNDLLTVPPTSPPVIPGDANTAAVLGWLHTNCGVSCHNQGNGISNAHGFFTRLDVDTLATVTSTDTYATGWNVQTSIFMLADASTTYRFHACDVGGSAAYYRSDVRDGFNGVTQGTQMPTVITHQVDTADMAAVAAWINAGCDGGM